MSPSELRTDGDRIFEIDPWVVAIQGDCLYRRTLPEPRARQLVIGKLRAGESPKELFGWSGERLPLRAVRSVAWVPDARTVLIRRLWLRDPWRLVFADCHAGETFFRTMAKLFPRSGEPVEARVGPHDLPLDPRIALGVMFTICGLLALVGGALEGIGQAPVVAFEFVFRHLGKALGLTAVLIIGGLALAVGIGGLIGWYRQRPMKVVVSTRD